MVPYTLQEQHWIKSIPYNILICLCIYSTLIAYVCVHTYVCVLIWHKTCRFSDVGCRESILNLIKRIGFAYETYGKLHNFVLDIMKLDVLNLFNLHLDHEIKDTLIIMIQTYIQRNGLRQETMKQAVNILVSLCTLKM